MKKYTFNSVDYIKKRYAFSFYQHPKTTHAYLFDASIKRVILANYKQYHFFSDKKTKQYTFAATKHASSIIQYPLQADLTRLVTGNIKYYPFQVAKPYKRYAFATKKTNYTVSYAFEGELKQWIPNNPKLYPFITTKPSKQYAFEAHYTRYNATYAFEAELMAFENGTYKQYTFLSHSERPTKRYAFESRKIARSIQYTFYLTTTEIFDVEIIRPDIQKNAEMVIEVNLVKGAKLRDESTTYEAVSNQGDDFSTESINLVTGASADAFRNDTHLETAIKKQQTMLIEDSILNAELLTQENMTHEDDVHESNVLETAKLLEQIRINQTDLTKEQALFMVVRVDEASVQGQQGMYISDAIHDAQKTLIDAINVTDPSHVAEMKTLDTITTPETILRSEKVKSDTFDVTIIGAVNVEQSGRMEYTEIIHNTAKERLDVARYIEPQLEVIHNKLDAMDTTQTYESIETILDAYRGATELEVAPNKPDRINPPKEDVYDAGIVEFEGLLDLGENAIIRRLESFETFDAIHLSEDHKDESLAHTYKVESDIQQQVSVKEQTDVFDAEAVNDETIFAQSVELEVDSVNTVGIIHEGKVVFESDEHKQQVSYIADETHETSLACSDNARGKNLVLDAEERRATHSTNIKTVFGAEIDKLDQIDGESIYYDIHDASTIRMESIKERKVILESTHNGEHLGGNFIFEGLNEQEAVDTRTVLDAAIETSEEIDEQVTLETIQDYENIHVKPVHEVNMDFEDIKVVPIHEVNMDFEDIRIVPVHEVNMDFEDIKVTPVFEAVTDIERINVLPLLAAMPDLESIKVTPTFEVENDSESISITPVFDTEIDISAFEVTPTFDTNTVQVDPFREPVPKIRKRMWLHQNRPQWAMKYFTQVRR